MTLAWRRVGCSLQLGQNRAQIHGLGDHSAVARHLRICHRLQEGRCCLEACELCHCLCSCCHLLLERHTWQTMSFSASLCACLCRARRGKHKKMACRQMLAELAVSSATNIQQLQEPCCLSACWSRPNVHLYALVSCLQALTGSLHTPDGL